MKTIIRPVRVFFALVPFVISFIRDWRGLILFGPPRKLTRDQHIKRARNVTRVFAELGPAFVKGAQVLATREDIIPKVYTNELKTLQDRVPAFPSSVALNIVRESTGKPLKQVFDSFDREPIAAASLGQVHKAVYQGQTVAVKILRPDVQRLVEIDLQVVGFLIKLIAMFVDNHIVQSSWTIHQEYTRMIRKEMDFRNEELHAERFRKNFAKNPNVIVPNCYTELTSQNVVVFDFVEGVRVDDYKALADVGVTRQKIIDELINVYVRMTVVHGFIHADPHPGNLLIDKQGRIVLLDYGMALDFPDSVRLEMLRGCIAIVRRDIDTLVDCLYKLNMVEPQVNRAKVIEACTTLFEIQLRDDFTPRMIQDIADDILNTFYKFPVRLPQQLVYLFRASALVEGLGMQYDQHFSGVRDATPIIKKMLREIALDPDKPIQDRVVDAAQSAWETAKDLRRVIRSFEREEQRIRIYPQDLDRIESALGVVMRRLLLGLGAASWLLFAGLVFVATNSMFWLLFLGVPAMSIFWLCVVLPIRRTRLERSNFF